MPSAFCPSNDDALGRQYTTGTLALDTGLVSSLGPAIAPAAAGQTARSGAGPSIPSAGDPAIAPAGESIAPAGDPAIGPAGESTAPAEDPANAPAGRKILATADAAMAPGPTNQSEECSFSFANSPLSFTACLNMAAELDWPYNVLWSVENHGKGLNLTLKGAIDVAAYPGIPSAVHWAGFGFPAAGQTGMVGGNAIIVKACSSCASGMPLVEICHL